MKTLLLVLLACVVCFASAKSIAKRQVKVAEWTDVEQLADAIIGMLEGNIDFPQLNPQDLPESSFKCEDQQLPGFYADTELQCQVVHHCDQERGIAGKHVCPNMTVFSQYYFTCMWAPTVDCAESPQFYSLNANLHVSPFIDHWGNPVPVAEYPQGPFSTTPRPNYKK